ncbi:IS3 family transposase [Bifidobacterium pseudocatenulatum]|uniref:IS3 family transposase n=1 Tax=Bifidobacterium pseudocatenulatum TaxID=28026 RepID=UPI003DA2C894
MSGPEERQRAVDLCSATPMTTAQVVEHLGHPTRQCLERWPAKDSQYAGHMDRPIIPLETRTKTIEPVPGGMRGSGPPNGSARASARSATGSGRIERAVWPRCGPKTGTPARPTSQRCDGIGTPATPRPRDAGSRSRNWGNAVMREVAEAFASSKGRYGYRRIMAEDGLTAHVPERRGYGSYEGEATPAPGDLADRMLVRAAETLPEGARPLVHSDRGCHCRRPGWLALMDHYGPARSTGAKGRSPDDAAAEGFFGRMKTEPVYPGHWEERTRDGVLVLIDDCIRWHDHGRIKRSLGWMSPVQIPSKPGNGCVIISKKTSAAPP